jgi:alpha-beta hydrolase superfamily lysophospholipase
VNPIVFGGRVGWLHPAQGDVGVVIAGAQGFEDLCSRRFLTVLAGQLAEAGMPVLQFDYSGCGNSAGDHAEPARLSAWISDIGAGIDCLKTEASVRNVVVIGFRLGALLAPVAVAGRDDVSRMALLAPPASGKGYVRELIGLSRIVDADIQPHPGQSDFDGVEASGFRSSAETIEDLRALAWGENALPAAGLDLLLMSPQLGAAHEAFASRVVAAGGKVETKPFDGYTQMMSRPSHDYPRSSLSEILEWAAGNGEREAGESSPAPHPETVVLDGDGYRERPLVLGSAPRICAVLCTPAEPPVTDTVVLLLNAGAIPHIGAARSAVDMARFLAGNGIASMRADLPGLGQSEAYAAKRTPLYDERTSQDVIRIVDWLHENGFRRICVAGLCAGAFQAFHAARSDARIHDLVMVNPLCFAWDSSYALHLELSNIRDRARASLPADDPQADQPQSSGQARALAVNLVKSVLRFSLESAKTLSLLWKRSTARSVEAWMRDLTRRGTRVLVVSSEGDLSLQEIARHFGPGGERLKRMSGVSTALISGANHTLTPLHARQRLNELIRQFLC